MHIRRVLMFVLAISVGAAASAGAAQPVVVAKFFVPTPGATGAVAIAGNAVGRFANKGMAGLAITPDGRTLVGAMQSRSNSGSTRTTTTIAIAAGGSAAPPSPGKSAGLPGV